MSQKIHRFVSAVRKSKAYSEFNQDKLVQFNLLSIHKPTLENRHTPFTNRGRIGEFRSVIQHREG